MIETYRPSGHVGAFTFPLWLLVFVPAAAIAFVYQLGLYYIPFIYLNFLMTLGVGIACSAMLKFVVKRGPCRNVLLTAVMAIVLGLATLAAKHTLQYFAFRAEIAGVLIEENQVPPAQQADFRRAFSEAFTVAEYIELRVEQGWEIGRGGRGLPINGWFVYLVWLLEAGIVVGFGLLAVSSARHPFNEVLHRWADEVETVATIPMRDPLVFNQIREARLVDDLLSPPAPDAAAENQFLVYKVYSVAGEEMEDAFLSIVQTTLTLDKHGKQQSKEQTLHQFVVLRKPHREQLLENIRQLQAEPAPAVGENAPPQQPHAANEFRIDTGNA